MEQSNDFTYKFEAVDGVDPLELVDNAQMSLHHHMSPDDGPIVPWDKDPE